MNRIWGKLGVRSISSKIMFTPPFVGSIDSGTSSTRFIVFDSMGLIVDECQKEFTNYYPHDGWCEQDVNEIYKITSECISTVCKKIEGISVHIKAVGITNQRETSVCWDKCTGEPLYNAIVWLDTRTKDLVSDCIEKTKSCNYFKAITGLPFSTYFSVLKLKWMLDNVESVKEANDRNNLMFGTIDSWLLYKLTGGINGGVHYTDVSNASRTMMMNLKTLDWDQEVLDFFGISKTILPQIRSSSEIFGKFRSGELQDCVISGILGDQQAALVGQQCFKRGMLKNTYGTGCFMLCNTGEDPVQSSHGLLTTVGYKMGPNSPCIYALEGSISAAGIAVRWLRDNLGIIRNSNEIEIFASSVPNTGGTYFVPAFSGLFAPYWRDDARAILLGMTLATTKHHICRATLEAVAFQTKDIMDAMEKDMNDKILELKVDGGMTESKTLIQIQADIADVTVKRSGMKELTAFGAAIAAALSVKIWDSIETIPCVSVYTSCFPEITVERRQVMRKEWERAVEKSYWIK